MKHTAIVLSARILRTPIIFLLHAIMNHYGNRIISVDNTKITITDSVTLQQLTNQLFNYYFQCSALKNKFIIYE